jgi:phage shock protein A
MGILTRMLRLCKADVHGVMDQLEDKGLLLKQSLREMENSLDLKERQVSTLDRRLNRLNGQINRHANEMDKLEKDLARALRKEKDDIARMLIRRRRALNTACMHLREQVETITQEKTRLLEILAEQRLQFDTLRAKADDYCRQAGHGLLDGAVYRSTTEWISFEPKDEEVELELLERKEAFQKGGAA